MIRLFLLLCLFVIFTLNGEAAEPRTYFKPQDFNCGSKLDCYGEIFSQAKKLPLQGLAINQKSYIRRSFNDYSLLTLQQEKPKMLIISTHGLYGDSQQFGPMVQSMLEMPGQTPFNHLELVLPGHTKWPMNWQYASQVENLAPTAKYYEWIDAFSATMSLARQLSSRVILMGQSTGALLSIMAAIENPDLVKGLVLIEPAIRVQAYVDVLACYGGSLLENPHSLEQMTSLFGYHPPSISVSMGCEVNKLGNEFYDDVAPGLNISDQIRVFAARLKIPVLVINNVNDFVVQPEAVKYFTRKLTTPHWYEEINQFGNLPHGTSTIDQPNMMRAKILQFFSNYDLLK